jgi:hypothetical protein
VTPWLPGGPPPDVRLVSPYDRERQLRYAGGVRFGLTAADRARLRGVLERVQESRSGRSRVRPVRPVIQVDVDDHGRPGGPLRDPVLRTATLAGDPRSTEA